MARGAKIAESVADGEAVERRLRQLGSVCVVCAAAVLVSAGGIGWLVFSGAGAGADWRSPAPPLSTFLAACGGLLLVLLASAAHSRALRRTDDELDLDDEARAAADDAPAAAAVSLASWRADRLRAYSWATGIAFGMLIAAAALGVGVAVVGRAPFYGLVIELASLFGMLARWPRGSGLQLALEAGERQP